MKTNGNANDKLIEAIESVVKRHIAESEARLKGSMFAMENRLSSDITNTNTGLDKLENRFDSLEVKVDALEGKVEAIHNEIKEIYSLI